MVGQIVRTSDTLACRLSAFAGLPTGRSVGYYHVNSFGRNREEFAEISDDLVLEFLGTSMPVGLGAGERAS